MLDVNFHNVRGVTVKHHAAGQFHEAFSAATIKGDDGSSVTLFVTAAQAEAIAAAFAPKINEAGIPVFDKPEPAPAPSCDTCGEDGDIRIIHRPYGRPDHICAACFANADPENSFTDYPLAKEAA